MCRYEQDLEKDLLEAAKIDTEKDAGKWLNYETTSHYLLKAETRLSDESYRARTYLGDTTESKLLQVCEQELLGSKLLYIVVAVVVSSLFII